MFSGFSFACVMRATSQWLLVFSSVLGWFVTTPAQAVLSIEITQGYDDATPIAIHPFQWQGSPLTKQPLKLDRVIHSDMLSSGIFKMLPSYEFPELIRDPDTVDHRLWKQKDVDAVVSGRIRETQPGIYEVQLFLIDVLRQRLALKHQWSNIKANQFRPLAHKISDMVYEALTGVKGVFSTKVAYVTQHWQKDDKPLYSLEVSDADGHNAKTVLRSNRPILSPDWSPDGRQLAYVTFENGSSEVVVHDLYTNKRQTIANYRGVNGAPAWSPDGRQMALSLSKSGNADLYIYDLQKRRLTQLTRHWAIDTEPTWSRDGQSLYFTSDRLGSPHIFQLMIHTGEVKRITYEGRYNAGATMSPEGRYLALIHGSGGNAFHVAIYDTQTGDFEVLTNTFLDESPSFAANGQMIVYSTTEGENSILAVIAKNGRGYQKLRESRTQVREPDWGPLR